MAEVLTRGSVVRLGYLPDNLLRTTPSGIYAVHYEGNDSERGPYAFVLDAYLWTFGVSKPIPVVTLLLDDGSVAENVYSALLVAIT
jgi:hypothetical protein